MRLFNADFFTEKLVRSIIYYYILNTYTHIYIYLYIYICPMCEEMGG